MTDPEAELNGPADLAPLCNGQGSLRAAWIYTPIGAMVCVADERGVHLLEFARLARLQAAFARLPGVQPGKTPMSDELQNQLVAYFAGRRAVFDMPIMRPSVTDFTARIWDAVAAVPYGATVTYGALAAGIGAPKAARAVGRANGANPLAILVPCHRITGHGGALTGYAGGLWRKEWLLAHEGRGLR